MEEKKKEPEEDMKEFEARTREEMEREEAIKRHMSGKKVKHIEEKLNLTDEEFTTIYDSLKGKTLNIKSTLKKLEETFKPPTATASQSTFKAGVSVY